MVFRERKKVFVEAINTEIGVGKILSSLMVRQVTHTATTVS
jgi:hypothetical protein